MTKLRRIFRRYVARQQLQDFVKANPPSQIKSSRIGPDQGHSRQLRKELDLGQRPIIEQERRTIFSAQNRLCLFPGLQGIDQGRTNHKRVTVVIVGFLIQDERFLAIDRFLQGGAKVLREIQDRFAATVKLEAAVTDPAEMNRITVVHAHESPAEAGDRIGAGQRLRCSNQTRVQVFTLAGGSFSLVAQDRQVAGEAGRMDTLGQPAGHGNQRPNIGPTEKAFLRRHQDDCTQLLKSRR